MKRYLNWRRGGEKAGDLPALAAIQGWTFVVALTVLARPSDKDAGWRWTTVCIAN